MDKRCTVVLLLLAWSASLAEAANNNRNQNQPRATKGAPAKGPSKLSYSETVNGRISSLGTPDDQKAAMEREAARKIETLKQAEKARKAEKRFVDQVRELLNADKNAIHQVDKDGRTLLHLAAFSGYANGVSYLLKNGAHTTITAKDAGGATAADLAHRVGRADIAATIQQFKP